MLGSQLIVPALLMCMKAEKVLLEQGLWEVDVLRPEARAVLNMNRRSQNIVKYQFFLKN